MPDSFFLQVGFNLSCYEIEDSYIHFVAKHCFKILYSRLYLVSGWPILGHVELTVS